MSRLSIDTDPALRKWARILLCIGMFLSPETATRPGGRFAKRSSSAVLKSDLRYRRGQLIPISFEGVFCHGS